MRLALLLLCALLARSAEAGTRALLVFGTQVKADGTPSAKLRRRLDKALSLAKADPRARIVVSGGSPGWSAEGPVMAAWLKGHGIAASRILVEDHATNSAENANLSVPLLLEHGIDEVTVVTERFHLPRALFHTRAALRETGHLGIRVDGAAAPDGLSGLARLKITVRERIKIWRDVGLRRRDELRGHAVAKVDALIRGAIRDRVFPGAAIAVGGRGKPLLTRAYGTHTYESKDAVTTRSKFDLASLTKVVATTTAAMKLFEAGRLDLDAPLAGYLPEYANTDKAKVTVRQILSHTAGFGSLPRVGRAPDRAGLLRQIKEQPLVGAPGTERYSDLGFIVLGEVIERITNESLSSFAQREIFVPLGMHDTEFRGVGAAAFDPSIVPTERLAGGLRRGQVHDEKAHTLGGIAGHAGLFSTAEDLGRFAQMLASGGMVDGKAFLEPSTIQAFVGAGSGARRALGWDRNTGGGTRSAGIQFGPGSYGHTGFTGTSLWIDPDTGSFAILLSNRVYPSRQGEGIDTVRPRFADEAHRLSSAL